MPPKRRANKPAPRRKPKKRPVRRVGRWLGLSLLLLAAAAVGTIYYLKPALWAQYFPTAQPPPLGREIESTAELQIALARRGFSPGSIDGMSGGQTRIALLAYQAANQLPQTGTLDAETAPKLRIKDPVFAQLELSHRDLEKVAPAPQSWRERAQLEAMAYNSVLEMVAEHSQSDPDYIMQLNPSLEWNHLQAGTRIIVPLIPSFQIPQPLAYLRIGLSERTLQAYDATGQLQFHCPVSIARRVEKRPRGELAVKVRVKNPNYTFNPEILTTVAQREGITQKFIIPPGPNNPVGTAWIGLNLPSYGIHGTPVPEKVGRTESSGCFRLANWNAEILLEAITVGLSVHVEP
ncbi:MAG: lipoprotein-anchoring transpeptidase ErfK/SrfK [Lentimonas sp.]|jgi:lipoprotein-anchoring transpeptidase ErfK/SrfK